MLRIAIENWVRKLNERLPEGSKMSVPPVVEPDRPTPIKELENKIRKQVLLPNGVRIARGIYQFLLAEVKSHANRNN